MKTLVLLLCLLPLPTAVAGERFACNLGALSPQERAHHQELSRALRTAVVEKTELKNGYGFRVAAKDMVMIAEWVRGEARCCPFFTFEIAIARDQGPVWLRITGPDGVKAFIKSEFEL